LSQWIPPVQQIYPNKNGGKKSEILGQYFIKVNSYFKGAYFLSKHENTNLNYIRYNSTY
jgi:hypothetical protein